MKTYIITRNHGTDEPDKGLRNPHWAQFGSYDEERQGLVIVGSKHAYGILRALNQHYRNGFKLTVVK